MNCAQYTSIPKKGNIVMISNIKLFEKIFIFMGDYGFPCNGVRVGDEIIINGPLYSSIDSLFPPRTMYREIPTENGHKQYLEVKGYGRGGREMYFQNHVSGDIFYGMYLDNVIKEFSKLSMAYDLGLPVPLPLAVVEIPRYEYMIHGLTGFQKTFESFFL